MPFVDTARIYRFLAIRKGYSENNPIKYFYQYRKAPPFVHYVSNNHQQLIPPIKQPADVLPHLWKLYIYPDYGVSTFLYLVYNVFSDVSRFIEPDVKFRIKRDVVGGLKYSRQRSTLS